MKELKILSVNERKNIIGGGPGIEACYCPGTGIFAGVIHPGEGETCAAVIEENCPLES